MSAMDDIFGPQPERPDTPDFWRLSEIILELKAEMQETAGDQEAQSRAWRARYEAIGDFDSIAYAAKQAAYQVHGIVTGADFIEMMADPQRSESFVRAMQTYFDGFIMGAEFMRRGGHRE